MIKTIKQLFGFGNKSTNRNLVNVRFSILACLLIMAIMLVPVTAAAFFNTYAADDICGTWDYGNGEKLVVTSTSYNGHRMNYISANYNENKKRAEDVIQLDDGSKWLITVSQSDIDSNYVSHRMFVARYSETEQYNQPRFSVTK